jgi:hypothetical protein
MQPIFPFEVAKDAFSHILPHFLPDELKNSAVRLLELHLDERALAMSKMVESETDLIKKQIIDGNSLENIISNIKFEDTNTKEGMRRVMVRTHLNRSGMNHVSMGHYEKTLSPRILNFVDSLSIDLDITEDQTRILKKWYEYALSNSARTESSDALFHDERAINTLRNIQTECSTNNYNLLVNNQSAPATVKIFRAKGLDIDLGWTRIILGFLSGLSYLQKRNWDVYKLGNTQPLSYQEIHYYIKNCQAHIIEYGYALAGSFFADLGSKYFVKDDTHVKAFTQILSQDINSPEKRVQTVIESGLCFNVAPRIIDKLMYLAGSGNFYLAGVKIANSLEMKKCYLKEIQSRLRLS